MGRVQDALNAFFAPAINAALQNLNIPADLAQQLEDLRNRPSLSDADRAVIDAARGVIEELDMIAAGIQSN